MKNKLLLFFSFFSWIITAAVASYNVFSGGMAFWYDPARDMLSAWDNLSKITLIGSTSGIPGIFYGPYWIWWLSLAEVFSKDPRVVLFLTTTLPYLILFPLFLYFFSRVYGLFTSTLLWILFFFAFQGYMTALWNPNLAPLLFLIVIYLFVTVNKSPFKEILRIFFAGILSGLAFNIHISFSMGFVVGLLLYIFLNEIIFKENKNKFRILTNLLKNIYSFIVGFGLVFWPFILFEVRHGFQQSKTFLNAVAHNGNVVAVHGLSKLEIIQQFFLSFGKLFSIPFVLSVILFITGCIVLFILIFSKKITLSTLEKRLILLLVCIIFAVLGIYLSVKNPIWGYHFVGMEIILLLFSGVIISKIPKVKYFVFAWVIIIAVFQIKGVLASFSFNPLSIDTLYAKEFVVSTIAQDAKGKMYSVFAYNPAIYNYDYSYLFRWKAKKYFSYDPGQVRKEGIVYLILPKGKEAALMDFVHFHTPDTLYNTTKTWTIPDGTVVIRRTPILSNI